MAAGGDQGERVRFACTHMALGELFRSQGREEEAAAALLQAAKLEPDNATAQYLAARQLYFNGQLGLAQHHAERAVALHDAPVYRDLLDRILEVRRSSVSKEGRTADGLLDAALRAFDRGEYELAQGMVEDSLGMQRSDAGRVLAAYLLLMERRFTEAEEALEALLAEQPGHPGATVGLAHLALARQENEAAAEAVEPLLGALREPLLASALEQEGYRWVVFEMAHLAMAWSHTNRAQHDLAIAHFDAVLSYQPKSLLALLGRGNSLNHLGRYREAERDLQHVLALRPGNAWAEAELGLVRLNQGDEDAATDHFEAALAAEPDGYTMSP